MRTIVAIGMKRDLAERLSRELNSREFTVVQVSSSKEGFEYLRSNHASLILLNNLLPGENYREFCIIIRSQEQFSGIPILLLAEKEESVDLKIEVLRSMVVNDYIASPFLVEEIVARINVFMELRELQEELEASNLLLKQFSITDELTGLFNRRHLFERLQEELRRVVRHKYDLCCCLADLDHFKKINDGFGHQTGDKVLVELAQVLKRHIRSIDILGRYGGEEFLLILPYTDLEKGLLVSERLRTRVKAHRFAALEGAVQTVSMGIVSFSHECGELSIDEVVKSVDEQLYAAKNGGRDKVCSRKFRADIRG